MFEIADRLLALLTDGHRVAVATVISMTGSGPTVVGTSMAVDDMGAAVGSVAGGCVEGALYELCASVLDGSGPGIQEYGVTDEDAFAVGLTCGGVLRVHARELGPADVEPLAAAARGDAAVLVTPLTGTLPADRVPDARTGIVRFEGPETGIEVFVEVVAAPARMVIYGALEFSSALATAARAVGYRVTVCDARAVLATPRRHPGADEVIVDWPLRHLASVSLDARDVVAVMSHDERYDAELVLAALRSGAGYVGAMGSRRTQDRRTVALVELGATADELDRLHAPIGLDLGASTPAETAVSVLAEVLAARAGASGLPLRRTVGPLHRLAVDRQPAATEQP